MTAAFFVAPLLIVSGCASQPLTEEEQAERQKLIDSASQHPETSNRARRERTRGR